MATMPLIDAAARPLRGDQLLLHVGGVMHPRAEQVEPIVEWPERTWHRGPLPTNLPPRFDARPDWLVAQPPGSDEFHAGWIAHAAGKLCSESPYCASRDADRYARWAAGWSERDRLADPGPGDERRRDEIDEKEDAVRSCHAEIEALKGCYREIRAEVDALGGRGRRLEEAARRMFERARQRATAAAKVDTTIARCRNDIGDLSHEIADLQDAMGTVPAAATNLDLELGL